MDESIDRYRDGACADGAMTARAVRLTRGGATVSKRNRSHTQTHDQNNTTNDHTKDHPPRLKTTEGGEQHHKRPHEGPPPSLKNDRRWRGVGAYHLPHPGWWPRRSQRGRVNPDRPSLSPRSLLSPQLDRPSLSPPLSHPLQGALYA